MRGVGEGEKSMNLLNQSLLRPLLFAGYRIFQTPVRFMMQEECQSAPFASILANVHELKGLTQD
jgi:hypothetical protein